jgi:hypothetical protein
MQRRDKRTLYSHLPSTDLDLDHRHTMRRKSCRMVLGALLFSALYFVFNATETFSVVSRGRQEMKPSTVVFGTASKDSKSSSIRRGRNFILQPESEFSPKISWLMSFPNSGTSFTMTTVARMSNRSIATNYADEVTAADQSDSLSIYIRRPEGPFWPGMSGKMSSPRALPDSFVLTKTHCGSRCVKCGPKEYIETPERFLQRCSSGHARMGPNRRRVDVEYPPDR